MCRPLPLPAGLRRARTASTSATMISTPQAAGPRRSTNRSTRRRRTRRSVRSESSPGQPLARTVRRFDRRSIRTGRCTQRSTPGALSAMRRERGRPTSSSSVMMLVESVLRLSRVLSIAVDPRNSDVVYMAYNDDQGALYVLHVLRSLDRGQTWSPELRHINNALNPALAINSAGKVGLVYQQLTGSGAAQQWVTRFETTVNGTAWTPLTLAQTAASIPPKQFDPYLGDYDHLMAVGRNFYGIFSTNNMPNKANFPNGVVYQRNANFNTHTLLNVDNVTPVRVSVDPFFFKVTG